MRNKANIPPREVILEKPDACWAAIFEGEKKSLIQTKVFNPNDCVIEHIGSTAINIWAKPIIDIAVGLKVEINQEQITRAMTENGYIWTKRLRIELPNRLFYWKGSTARHTHHVHIMKYDGEDWNELICFKKYLLQRPHRAKWYEQKKLEIANGLERSDDINSYIDRKYPVFRRLVTEAREYCDEG